MRGPKLRRPGGGQVIDDLTGNRLVLLESQARMAALGRELADRRQEMIRLRSVAHETLSTLRDARVRTAEAPQSEEAAMARPGLRLAGRPDPVEKLRFRLHEQFAAGRDPALRAELMAIYEGFACSLARRFFRQREAADDLLQVARIGLLQSIDRFDPALGRPFVVFARATITGELKRHVRDRTWSTRVPRSLKDDYLTVMRAVDELTARESGSPSMQALADHCGLSVERVVEALELRTNQWALSLDGLPAGEEGDITLQLGEEDLGFRRLEDRQLLACLLDRLPERDRRIIELRFLHDMTQAEIAAEVGVSQMCISRVLVRTLGRLRIWARSAVA